MSLVLTVALVVALAVSGWRLQRRIRLRRALEALPGGSVETALQVSNFSDIDVHLARRRCSCGGGLESKGERSERRDPRLLRVVRVECRLCERRGVVYFDVSRVYH